jgi:hypothetical protein
MTDGGCVIASEAKRSQLCFFWMPDQVGHDNSRAGLDDSQDGSLAKRHDYRYDAHLARTPIDQKF